MLRWKVFACFKLKDLLYYRIHQTFVQLENCTFIHLIPSAFPMQKIHAAKPCDRTPQRCGQSAYDNTLRTLEQENRGSTAETGSYLADGWRTEACCRVSVNGRVYDPDDIKWMTCVRAVAVRDRPAASVRQNCVAAHNGLIFATRSTMSHTHGSQHTIMSSLSVSRSLWVPSFFHKPFCHGCESVVMSYWLTNREGPVDIQRSVSDVTALDGLCPRFLSLWQWSCVTVSDTDTGHSILWDEIFSL